MVDAPRIGAHVSISGGVGNAIGRQKDVGGNCGQIFVSSPRSWTVKDQPGEEIERFKRLREEEGQIPYAAHAKYLVNLGSPNGRTRGNSIEALQKEMDVASSLGIEYVVFHPGAHTGGVDRNDGMRNVSQALEGLEIHKGLRLLLENTSGRGNTLGRNFAELRTMIEGSGQGFERLGVCFDTCHGFCAGYPIHESDGLDSTLRELEGEIGRKNLHLVHLNDSKHPFGSTLDEHQDIGMGHIGEEAFRRMLGHEMFRSVPMVLETPESPERGYRWNISKVRKLMGL